MCFGSVKVPPPPKQPQPEDAMTAALRERQKRAGGLGFGSTVLGGSMGTSSASTSPKSLLGQ
jgi:hypothetical protein